MNSSPVVCPHCQATTAANQPCWLCHGRVSGGEGQDTLTMHDAYAPPPPVDIADGYQSAVVGIVLVIGVLVVCAAMFQVAPGLAFWIAVLSTPALIRTTVVIMRKERSGEPISTSEKSMLFLASVGGVIVACIASGAAFFIACTASCFGLIAISSTGGSDEMAWILLAGSVLFSLVAGGFVLYLMWRKK